MEKRRERLVGGYRKREPFRETGRKPSGSGNTCLGFQQTSKHETKGREKKVILFLVRFLKNGQG